MAIAYVKPLTIDVHESSSVLCVCAAVCINIPGGFLPGSLLLGLPDCCESVNTKNDFG